MTAPIAFFADHPVTRQAEQVRRQREIDFARGSVRLEGGHLTDEIERLNARYVAGQIESDGLTTAILASETARSWHGPED